MNIIKILLLLFNIENLHNLNAFPCKLTVCNTGSVCTFNNLFTELLTKPGLSILNSSTEVLSINPLNLGNVDLRPKIL